MLNKTTCLLNIVIIKLNVLSDVRSNLEESVVPYRSSRMVSIPKSTTTATAKIWREAAFMNGALVQEMYKYNTTMYALLHLIR